MMPRNPALLSVGCHSALLFQEIPMGPGSLTPIAVDSGEWIVVSPTRKRGRPPAQVLAQPRPSPPPSSTGNGVRALLRPSPCRSRRQGGRCGIAGKLSGTQRECMRAGRPRSRVGRLPSLLLLNGARAARWGAALPMRQNRHVWRPFVDHSFFACFRYDA